MLQANFTQQNPKIQLTSRQGQQMTFEEIAPDFAAYPWAGLIWTLYWSYRRGYYSLADLALDKFVELSQRGQP